MNHDIKNFLTENKELDLNAFFKDYVDNLIDISKKKQKAIELFSHSENVFKAYKEALNPLFAITDEMNLKLLSAQENELIKSLEHYVPDDIDSNKKMINITIAFLENIKSSVKTITDQFLSVEQLWKKRNIIVPNHSFMISELENKFKDTIEIISNFNNIDNIESVITKITNLKNEINKIIIIFQKINTYINMHVYVGDSEKELQNEIYNFVENKIQSCSISQFLTEFDIIEKKFTQLKEDRKYKTKAFEVIKYEAKNDKHIYYYAVDINGVEIKLSDINLEEKNKERIDKYIYVDYFPESGIFEIDELFENMQLSNNQIEASYEIDKKSLKMFLISVLIQIITGVFMVMHNLSFFKGILISILLWLIFYFLLTKQEYSLSEKYSIPKFMILTKINFGIYSTGDFINVKKFNSLLFRKFHQITNTRYREIKLIKEN